MKPVILSAAKDLRATSGSFAALRMTWGAQAKGESNWTRIKPGVVKKEEM
jgi:hypothetical protein